MGDLLLLIPLGQPGVVQTPAHIVMAAEIVLKQAGPGQGADLLHLVAEQSHIPGGHRVPGGTHGGGIVEHIALGALRCTEVGGQFGGLHHHLPQQQHPGADHLAGQVDQPHQCVHLRQIAAVSPQLFPDIRHRVQADDVNAPVG